MSNNKTLLVDIMNFDVSPLMIEESIRNNNGKIILRGVIQRANSLNQNKRVYPRRILEREVTKYMELVRDRRSTGELDHASSTIINLSNVSHLITELYWKGDDVIGAVELIPTPSGNIAKTLIESNVKLGISSRGLGSVKELGDGSVEVMDDFEILCWDLVSNPSTQGAFIGPITESVDGLLIRQSNNNKINEIISEIFSNLNYNCGNNCEWLK